MPSQNNVNTCPPGACPGDAAPEFRKKFTTTKKIRSATFYNAAFGMADVTNNGKKVTDEVLGPPFSDYSKPIMYVAYDVTGLVKPGENVIGPVPGNGLLMRALESFISIDRWIPLITSFFLMHYYFRAISTVLKIKPGKQEQ